MFHLSSLILQRAGAKVTIIHRGKQPLEHFDPDLVNKLVQRSKDIGIDVILQEQLKASINHHRHRQQQTSIMKIETN